MVELGCTRVALVPSSSAVFASVAGYGSARAVEGPRLSGPYPPSVLRLGGGAPVDGVLTLGTGLQPQ